MKTDVVIVGAGIAGLVLGISLAKAGVRVHMIEKMPPPAFDHIQPSGRTVALFGESMDRIRGAGVWDKIAPYCQSMDALKIVDGQTDVTFHAADSGQERFGYNIPVMILRAALYEQAAATQSLIIHEDTAVERFDVTQCGVTVELGNGKALHAALLIGADGRNSFVRGQCGIDVKRTDYEQTAMTFLVDHAAPHDNVSTEFHKPGGPLALVPMPGYQSSVVWVEKTEDAERLLRLKKQDLMARFQTLTQGVCGECDIITAVQSWPLSLIKADALTAPRVALVAEAAHVLPPISAQGLNLSLRDVRDICDLVVRHHKIGLDIGSSVLLRDYERARRRDIQSRMAGVNALNVAVMGDILPLFKIRKTGLKLLSQTPFLKNQVMRLVGNS